MPAAHHPPIPPGLPSGLSSAAGVFDITAAVGSIIRDAPRVRCPRLRGSHRSSDIRVIISACRAEKKSDDHP